MNSKVTCNIMRYTLSQLINRNTIYCSLKVLFKSEVILTDNHSAAYGQCNSEK